MMHRRKKTIYIDVQTALKLHQSYEMHASTRPKWNENRPLP